MGLAQPLSNAVRGRVRRACLDYLDGRLVSPQFGSQRSAGDYWEDLAAEAGVEVEHVVRVRPDTRAVLVVRHPEWGRCVLKTVLASRHPKMGLSNQLIAQIAMGSGAPIFPRVYHATINYTLEQYVEGRPFREWMESDFSIGPAADYLEHLRAWSLGHHAGLADATLKPVEVRDLCRSYLSKCIRHARFFSATRNLKSVVQMFGDGDLEARVAWLWEEAGRLDLPKTMMCGDMGNVNLVVQDGTDRVFNIDYETLGPGHWGFDCGYLVSSLAKMGDSDPAVDQVRAVVFDGDYLGGAQATEFFRVYTDVLTEISRTIYGSDGRAGAPWRPWGRRLAVGA